MWQLLSFEVGINLKNIEAENKKKMKKVFFFKERKQTA